MGLSAEAVAKFNEKYLKDTSELLWGTTITIDGTDYLATTAGLTSQDQLAEDGSGYLLRYDITYAVRTELFTLAGTSQPTLGSLLTDASGRTFRIKKLFENENAGLLVIYCSHPNE